MTDTVNVQREPTQAEIEAVFDILDSGELGEDFCSADVCRAMLAAAPKAEPVDIAALDRLFYGGKAYIGAEEAVRQISDLQSELAAIRAQPAAPEDEPVSDPYKLDVLPLGTPVEVDFKEAEVGHQTLYVAGVTADDPNNHHPSYWLSETWPVKCRGDISDGWDRSHFTVKAQPLSNPQQLPEAQKGEPKDDRTETCVKCCGNGEIVTDWEEYLSPPEGAPADHATADCPACDGIGKVHPVYTNPASSSELLEVAEALIPIARKDTRLGKAGDNLRKALNRLEDAIAKHKGPQS